MSRTRAWPATRWGAGVVAAVLVMGAVAACGAPVGPTSTPEPSRAAASPTPPPTPAAVPAGTVDYQLGGAYPPAPGVVGVVRDSTEDPEPGIYSICYVNGFQTQPDQTPQWLAEHPDLVLRDEAGEPVADEAWPDEVLLDTSDADRRARVAEVLAPTLERCAAAGFDALELDNLDSWTRSGGRLTADDALALAADLVDHAHSLGLAVAQKNAAELGTRGRDEAGFDLAVTESCHRWDECQVYTDVYGDQVVAIEYTDELRGTFDEVCADPATPRSMVLRDRDLLPAGAAGHVLDQCEEET